MCRNNAQQLAVCVTASVALRRHRQSDMRSRNVNSVAQILQDAKRSAEMTALQSFVKPPATPKPGGPKAFPTQA